MTAKANPGTRPAAAMTVQDVAFLACLPFIFVFSCLAPAALQTSAARLASRFRARLKPAAARRDSALFASPYREIDADKLADDVRTHFYLERLHLFRLACPFHRLPATSVAGREHIDRALAAGTGAVLWVVPTVYAPLATKVALNREGIGVSHLSRTTHGISRSRLGQKILNPLQTRIEERFLDGRVVIENNNVREALTELTRRVASNRVVSITVGTEASRLVPVPFLNGKMTVAPRPVDFARRAGAPLLPVVTLRNADGSFTTEIGPSVIEADDVEGEDGEISAIKRLAKFVEPRAVREPSQFAKAKTFYI